MKLVPVALASIAALAAGLAPAQDSDVLQVYSSNGVRSVLQEMQPQIEAAVGKSIAFEFSTSRTLTDRIVAGDVFDVAVLTPALIDELIAAQKVAPESRIEFAQVGVGVGSRQGTPAKRVSTLEDLGRTLLEAESVAYGERGQSRRTNEASFETLGISDEIRAKARLSGAGEGPVLVAEGQVELVLTLISELLREPGVQFLGPLPPEVQGYIRFEAGVSAATQDRATGQALIDFLSTPGFVEALEQHGLEPISR